MNAAKGRVIVLSGPSGVGKGTVKDVLLSRHPDLVFSVSMTTRLPRPKGDGMEEDGVDYRFVSAETFMRMIAEDGFLEYAHVFGTTYYGTPRAFVDEQRAQGHDVLLEIEVQGGMKVMQAVPDCISVFLLPPSMDELRARLFGRKTENEEAIVRRLKTAEEELSVASCYKYRVVNDHVERAVYEIEQILYSKGNDHI